MASITTPHKEWLMLWILQGKPTQLDEARIRRLPVEAFTYLKRNQQFRCQLTDTQYLHVEQLHYGGVDRPNYLVGLVTRWPNKRRNTIKHIDEQCTAHALQATINQLLDFRPAP